MKNPNIYIFSLFLLSSPLLFAEQSVKLEGVHLCCKACVRGVDSAVAGIDGASVIADKDTGTVVLSGPDKKTLRKGMNAMMRAGFYGTPADDSLDVKDRSGAKDQKVTSLTIEGVHLCCGGCVDALNEALATVEGVTGNTAEKKADAFEVTGEFNDKHVFAALNKAGFAGRIAD